jgi:hypothetical protein
MAWNYKPKKGIIISFVIAVFFVSYGVQCVVKQNFISNAVTDFVADKYNRVRFQGIPLSVYDARAEETVGWFYNPLDGWEVLAALCVLFIGIGVLIVYHKSRVLGLEGNAANYRRRIEELEKSIRDKNATLSEREEEKRNNAAEIGNLRKELSQYRANYDFSNREITKTKEQCQAALQSKDYDHAKIVSTLKDDFAEVILVTKKECRIKIEQIKKQYENRNGPVDITTI